MRKAAATREALVDAVIRLMGERSVADISVKDIARAAGVNHGLVHRYFGSKEGLVREAVRRITAEVNRGPEGQPPTSWTFQLLRDRPELARIVARCCLDGPRDLLKLAAPPPGRLEEYCAPIHATLKRAGLARAIDPHVINAAGVAALLGWVVFKPLFKERYGLPRDADAQFARMVELVDAFVSGT